MSVFRLDSDKFDRQLGRLENAGEKFDTAQHQFAVGAQAIAGATTGARPSGSSPGSSGSSGGEHWSGIGELDQFHSPLHASVIALDGRLSSVSRSQKAAIGRMRQALRDFTELNDAEKNAYLGRLQALDSKFTYRRPDEMAGIIKKYNQASSLAERFATISNTV